MVTARDIMTREVETVSPDDDVSDVLTRLARADFNGFPVTEDGLIVGIVTQGDLVDLFQPSDRTLWIPIGFPPFLESLTYGVDLSWDELDVGLDLARNAGRPISEVMTEEVVTVGPKTDLDEILALLADETRDINRLPVVDEAGALLGIIARQDVLRALKVERDAGTAADGQD
jgi:CBS domain-containing protein